MKKKGIWAASAVLLIALIIYSQKIYFPIEGTVVDAETGKPIEGAVVLAEWTITRGIALTATEPYEAVEMTTTKNGKFNINIHVLNPFVNKPDLTIYKAGYVCWNNKFIFPGYKPIGEYMWKSNLTYAMEKFRKEYSYIEHVHFIESRVTTFTLVENKSAFIKAYWWERLAAQEESRRDK